MKSMVFTSRSSRPASPAPVLRLTSENLSAFEESQSSNGSNTQTMTMTRVRPDPAPLQHQTSGVPESNADTTNTTRRSLQRLSSAFKRSKSATAPTKRVAESAPITNLTMTPLAVEPPTAVSGPGVGAAYLDAISLRFAEAVSKALAPASGAEIAAIPAETVSSGLISSATQPSGTDPCAAMFKGKHPVPAGRGEGLGNIIASELNRAGSDTHLSRAIVRTLQRPLSVLMTSLGNLLYPLLGHLSSPQSSENRSVLAIRHAVAIAAFAAELLETLPPAQHASPNLGTVDGLKTTRDGLESVVNRIITPLIGSFKVDLYALADRLVIAPSVTSTASDSAVSALVPAIKCTGAKLAKLHAAVPGDHVAKAQATLVVGLVWKALVALSNRPLGAEPFTQVSLPIRAGAGAGKDRILPMYRGRKDTTSSGAVTAEVWQPAADRKTPSPPLETGSRSTSPGSLRPSFTSTSISSAPSTVSSRLAQISRIPLPLPRSRPPSPGGNHTHVGASGSGGNVTPALSRSSSLGKGRMLMTPLQALKLDADCVLKLINTLSVPNATTGIKLASSRYQHQLAKEAIQEAFEDLAGFSQMLACAMGIAHSMSTSTSTAASTIIEKEHAEELVKASEEVPLLIALGVLVQLLPRGLFAAVQAKESAAVTVPSILKISSEEYASSCLAGFGCAESASELVGRGVLLAMSKRQNQISSASGSPATPGKELPPSLFTAWLEERIRLELLDDAAH